MKVLLFTRSLNAGGAERQLALLAKQLHLRGVPVAVMVFYGKGPFRYELDNSGVNVIDLKKSGRWDVFKFLLRTITEVRRYKPHVIYNFIGAHLISTLLRPFFGGVKIVWGVRASNIDFSQYDWLSRISDRLSQKLSRFADGIICNSQAGKRYIMDRGYRNRNVFVIENGINTELFCFNPSLRDTQRKSWNIPNDTILIGIVARLDPMKDHRNFFQAARLCLQRNSTLHFVCVGGGNSEYGQYLFEEAQACGLGERLLWVGHESNLASVYSALDIYCSSSFSEGFPNTVAEAMACGLPVVSTDVGDCREIVGECGWIVPASNPSALAEALAHAVAALPYWQKEQPRSIVIQKYSVDAMVNQTLAALVAVCSQ
jgi:glycosyltransferase involved in cell wall biosynthesis